MKFYIWHDGDRSVGIPGAQCVLEWEDLKENPSDKESQEFIKFVKENLQETFKNIFDNKRVHVMTDGEYESYCSIEY